MTSPPLPVAPQVGSLRIRRTTLRVAVNRSGVLRIRVERRRRGAWRLSRRIERTVPADGVVSIARKRVTGGLPRGWYRLTASLTDTLGRRSPARHLRVRH